MSSHASVLGHSKPPLSPIVKIGVGNYGYVVRDCRRPERVVKTYQGYDGHFGIPSDSITEFIVLNHLYAFPALPSSPNMTLSLSAAGVVTLDLPYWGIPLSTIRPKVDETRIIMQDLIELVAKLHKVGYVHNDIKPENILVHEKARLIDFGISSPAYSCGQHPHYTLYYRPPECLGGTAVKFSYPESDLWALACVWGELLIGAPLFSCANERELALQHKRLDSMIEMLTKHPKLSKSEIEVLTSWLQPEHGRRMSAATAYQILFDTPLSPEVASGPDSITIWDYFALPSDESDPLLVYSPSFLHDLIYDFSRFMSLLDAFRVAFHAYFLSLSGHPFDKCTIYAAKWVCQDPPCEFVAIAPISMQKEADMRIHRDFGGKKPLDVNLTHNKALLVTYIHLMQAKKTDLQTLTMGQIYERVIAGDYLPQFTIGMVPTWLQMHLEL